MIYFYKSISPHKIETLQKYLEYFFNQLFKDSFLTYTHKGLIDPSFQAIIDEYKTQIDDKLKAIHKEYTKLKPASRTLVKTAFKNNNNIESICSSTITPYKYSDLPKGIAKSVKSLYDNLWDSILGYVRVEDKCGTLKSHFNKFRKINSNSVCPFCGIDGLLNEFDDLKNAYDHYIPQKKYPFCSILFANLSPICDTCNRSGNKGAKDIPFNEKTKKQRPIYFPFSKSTGHKINLSITSSITELKNPKKWVLDINCVPITNSSKKDAWIDIFNIEKRYKAIIAKESYKWKDKIIQSYVKSKKRAGFNLTNFISDKIDDFADVENQKEAIIKKCFHEFYLHHPGFKKSLKGIV